MLRKSSRVLEGVGALNEIMHQFAAMDPKRENVILDGIKLKFSSFTTRVILILAFRRNDMRFRWIVSLCALLAASYSLTATAEETHLSLGDAAPKIQVAEFVKGTPVKQFEAGKTYVVEFWATWCGPCLQSIPHLTELQKKNSEVVFMGISIDEDGDEVKAFVKEMGDKMGYRVAVDSRTEDAADGLMYKTWLAASLQEGIPASFIVNKEGKIAWIGHPGEIEEPLGQIVAGTWDLDAEVKKYAEILTAKKLAAAVENEFALAVEAKKYKPALELLDLAISKNPGLEAEWALSKLWTLILLKETDKAVEFGQHVINEVHPDDPQQLLIVAGLIVRPEEFAPFGFGEGDASDAETPAAKPAAENKASEKPEPKQAAVKQTDEKISPKLIELAIEAAERAADLSGDSPDIAQRTTVVELLASAYTLGGQDERATEVLSSELELLNEQLAVTKAAVLMIKSQLNALKDKSEKDQPEKKESASPEGAPKKLNPKVPKVEE